MTLGNLIRPENRGSRGMHLALHVTAVVLFVLVLWLAMFVFATRLF